MNILVWKKGTAFNLKCLLLIILLTNTLGLRGVFAKGPYALGRINFRDCDRSFLTADFFNNTEKTVSGIEIILSFYDSDGESVFENDWITIILPLILESHSKAALNLSLEEYSDQIPEECNLDYIYVSEIRYSDGSLWEDPFGRYQD